MTNKRDRQWGEREREGRPMFVWRGLNKSEGMNEKQLETEAAVQSIMRPIL